MTAVEDVRRAYVEVVGAIDRKRTGASLAEEAATLAGSFREFTYAAWPHLGYPPIRRCWHIDAICEHVQAAYERQILRLLVSIQPGAWKSTVLSVLAPAWRWTHAPAERFVSASHSDDLSTRDTRASRSLMIGAWYSARWGDVFQLAADENLKTRYSNDQSGHRVRTHVGGGTGDRGTICQLDDPHNAKEIHSDAMLQAAKDWWSETWASRLDDSVERRGVKIVIGQRIHPDDLIGFLLDSDEDAGRWTHLCLPTRYEARHPYVTPARQPLRGGGTILGDPREEEGALLAPGVMDEELLAERTAETTASVFAAQYQQRPAPREGALLKRALWRYYDPSLSFYAARDRFDRAAANGRLPTWQRIILSWDTSVKDRAHSDHVAGQAWGVPADRPADRWLLRSVHGRMGLNATIEAMIQLYEWTLSIWPDAPVTTLIESAANGPDAIAEIRARVQGVVSYTARGSKGVRAEAAEPALAGRNCVLPGYANETGDDYDPRTPNDVQRFVEELASFDPARSSQQDDQVDAWSQMINWTRKQAAATTTSIPTRARADLQQPGRGTSGQHPMIRR